jgi:hypothetical protein
MTLRLRPRRREDGAAAVEFALVLSVLLYLVFGIIQYGLYFWATNATSSAAREALRMAVVGNCQGIVPAGDYAGIGKLEALVKVQVGGAGEVVDVNPDHAGDFSDLEVGEPVTVTVEVQSIDLNFPFIPQISSCALGQEIRT